jgi:hypothetical protein
MGLDMYLYAERYVSGSGYSDPTDKETYNTLLLAVNGDKFATKDMPSGTVRLKVGYWRKANAIHDYFVRECQNGVDECQETYIERDSLIELRDKCLELIKNKGNNDLASKLLPTAEGFFFGGTEYDDWYWQEIENTYKLLTDLLIDVPENWEFIYRSSW